MDAVISFFSEVTVDGVALWMVLLCCCGVFLASCVDAIGGGGGIISVPVYLMVFSTSPVYFAIGTNKVSSTLSTCVSTIRFIRGGYVDWGLCIPGMVLAALGSTVGVWLQHHTPDMVLKYTLLALLPIVAFLTLRAKNWPEEPGEISLVRQRVIVCVAAALVGIFDGYYGPGSGTFLMLSFIHFGKLDVRRASGCTKVINLSSNIGGLISILLSGYVYVRVGLICAVAGVLGANLGASLAIKNGAKIVKPVIVGVLILLCLKVGGEVLLPGVRA